MTELVDRLRASTGFKAFIASDGKAALKADTDLTNEAADEIERLQNALLYVAKQIPETNTLALFQLAVECADLADQPTVRTEHEAGR